MISDQQMLPTFFTGKSLNVFLAFLVFTLTLPLWIEFVVSQEDAYNAIPGRMGAFSWHKQAIFVDQEPVDVAFIGGSGVWTALDPDHFSMRWKERYNEDVTAINLGHNWHGDILDYVIVHDLIDNREIEHIVLDAPIGRQLKIHPATKYIWNFWAHREASKNLSMKQFFSLYAEKTLVSPRLLYTRIVRPKRLRNANAFLVRKGHNRVRRGYTEWSTGEKFEYREDLNISPPGTTADSLLFINRNPDVKNSQLRPNLEIRDYTKTFATEKNIAVSLILVPRLDIFETEVELPETEIPSVVVGTSLNELFASSPRDEYRHYFYNRLHLNDAGARYYTDYILPALYEIRANRALQSPISTGEVTSVVNSAGASFADFIASVEATPPGERFAGFENCERATYKAKSIVSGCEAEQRSFDDIRIYAKDLSVQSGEVAILKVALAPHLASADITDIKISGVKGPVAPKIEYSSLQLTSQPCQSFFGQGCEYDGEIQIETSSLDPGMFKVHITASGHSGTGEFIVHKKDSSAETLIIVPEFTAQAYNRIGGGSIYTADNFQTGFTEAPYSGSKSRVSLRRPISNGLRTKAYDPVFYAQSKLHDWGESFAVLTDVDLQSANISLQNYKRMIFLGHHEYWTRAQTDLVRNYIFSGGDVLNFSGNILWYATNFEGDEILVDKGRPDENQNAIFSGTGFSMYGHWERSPEYLFGVSYKYAGYPVSRILKGQVNSPDDDDVQVLCDHPMFTNIGVRKGDYLGSSRSILDVELDGLPLDASNQIILDGISLPKGAKIRAVSRGNATATSVWGRKPPKSRLNTALVLEYVPGEGSGTVVTFGSIGAGTSLQEDLEDDDNASRLFRSAFQYLKTKSSENVSDCNWVYSNSEYVELAPLGHWAGNATFNVDENGKIGAEDSSEAAVVSVRRAFNFSGGGENIAIEFSVDLTGASADGISLIQYNFLDASDKTLKQSLLLDTASGKFRISGSARVRATVNEGSAKFLMIVPAPSYKDVDINLIVVPAYQKTFTDTANRVQATGNIVLRDLSILNFP